ncbi:MAG: glycosyltransferase family 2 protein [Bacteroidales bacterium]
MNVVFVYIDFIFFLLLAFSVCYLLIFALASLLRSNVKYPESGRLYKILVLFPAYKEDSVIVNSVETFLNQEYPATHYDVVVISDRMTKETNDKLRLLPVKVMEINFEDSSKARALNYAIDNIGDSVYDIVIIMDADNTTEADFLVQICKAYDSGARAIQAHRVAKNLNTDTAILDAVSEEINNSIFRRGHVNLGLSSALIGSGVAFDFKWFKENVKKVSTAGEDKELEILLLKQRIFIEYMEEVKVFDEKTQKDAVFYRQRRRWQATQFDTLKMVLKDLPGAIFSSNISFADKIVQWMLLPRVILLGLTGIIAIFISFVSITYAVKWWILLFLLIFTLALSIPDYLVNRRFISAIKKVPVLFGMMVLNLFKIRNAGRKFIHTEKNF